MSAHSFLHLEVVCKVRTVLPIKLYVSWVNIRESEVGSDLLIRYTIDLH